MRFGGFDFFADGHRAAIGTWNGDVWIVSGIDGDLQQLVWKRIAAGLFQPLVPARRDVNVAIRLLGSSGQRSPDWVRQLNIVKSDGDQDRPR